MYINIEQICFSQLFCQIIFFEKIASQPFFNFYTLVLGVKL